MRQLQTAEDFIDEHGLDRDAIHAAADAERARIKAYELRQIRKSLGITQQQVAESMGVSQKRISDIESGRPGAIQLDTLSRYAKSLGGSLEIVFLMPNSKDNKRVVLQA